MHAEHLNLVAIFPPRSSRVSLLFSLIGALKVGQTVFRAFFIKDIALKFGYKLLSEEYSNFFFISAGFAHRDLPLGLKVGQKDFHISFFRYEYMHYPQIQSQPSSQRKTNSVYISA